MSLKTLTQMQQIKSFITSAEQLLTSWVRLFGARLIGETHGQLFIQGDSFMGWKNSPLLLPERMKQLGDSQSKYEKKHICTFGDQKSSARHSLPLFIAVIANCCHSAEDQKESTHNLKPLKSEVETTVKRTESFDQF